MSSVDSTLKSIRALAFLDRACTNSFLFSFPSILGVSRGSLICSISREGKKKWEENVFIEHDPSSVRWLTHGGAHALLSQALEHLSVGTTRLCTSALLQLCFSEDLFGRICVKTKV